MKSRITHRDRKSRLCSVTSFRGMGLWGERMSSWFGAGGCSGTAELRRPERLSFCSSQRLRHGPLASNFGTQLCGKRSKPSHLD